jgi:hypothetical protein
MRLTSPFCPAIFQNNQKCLLIKFILGHRNSLREVTVSREHKQRRSCRFSMNSADNWSCERTHTHMSKRGAAAGSKKRKAQEEEEDIDWDALLGEEMEGGVDLDDFGRVMVDDSRIRWAARHVRL